MTAVLQVATPEGDNGKIFSSAVAALFRYHEDANQFDLTTATVAPSCYSG